jgi:hypothetical protein
MAAIILRGISSIRLLFSLLGFKLSTALTVATVGRPLASIVIQTALSKLPYLESLPPSVLKIVADRVAQWGQVPLLFLAGGGMTPSGLLVSTGYLVFSILKDESQLIVLKLTTKAAQTVYRIFKSLATPSLRHNDLPEQSVKRLALTYDIIEDYTQTKQPPLRPSEQNSNNNNNNNNNNTNNNNNNNNNNKSLVQNLTLLKETPPMRKVMKVTRDHRRRADNG